MGKTQRQKKYEIFSMVSNHQKQIAKRKTKRKNKGLRMIVKNEIWKIPYERIPHRRFGRNESEWTL